MAKRARSVPLDLRSVVNIRGVSRRALFDIISRLGGDEVPTSEWELRQQSLARYEEVRHTIEMPSEGSDGTVEWNLCHPLKTLDLLLKENDTMQEWYLNALRRHPCTSSAPWRLLIGWDEFVPGNKLAIDNSRKTMCLSFTFDELDEQRDLDIAWITPVMVRTTLMKRVRGGWSNMLRAFLHLLLLDDGRGLQAAGHPVMLRGTIHLLFARVDLMMADGDGLRLALQWLGAGAVKPCWRHWNVLKRASALLSQDSRGIYVDITCADASKFRSWSNAELGTAADVCVAAHEQCAAGEIPKVRLTEIERGFGYRVTGEGLLADRTLRRYIDFCGTVHYDWVHTLLEDGAITREAWALLHACDTYGFPGAKEFHDFLANRRWCAPRGTGEGPKRRRAARDLSQLAAIFAGGNRDYQDDSEAIKCAASDWFTLYALLRYWVLAKIPEEPRLEKLRTCVLVGLECIAILIAAKRGRTTRADAANLLRGALARHTIAHVDALGSDAVRPKMHWAFDLVDYLGSGKSFMDCLVIERLHLRVRGVAQNCKRLDTYEQSVCAGVLNQHCNALAGARRAPGLQGPVAPMPSMEHVSIADWICIDGKSVAVSDLVCKGPSVGRVLACCFDNVVHGLVVDKLRMAPGTSAADCKFLTAGGAVEVWLMPDIEPCVAWTQDEETLIAILP